MRARLLQSHFKFDLFLFVYIYLGNQYVRGPNEAAKLSGVWLPFVYYNLTASCRLRVVSLLSWRFLTKPDCILSPIQLIKLSFGTDKRAVSEGISYPIITDLDILPADYPIFIIITREVQLTLIPPIRFQIVVVNESLREFPSL